MPCGRTHHRRVLRDAFPDDFPQALENFKEASGMTWDEIAWLLGTTTTTVWRWWKGRTRPNAYYLTALHNLAADLGLEHLLPTVRVVRAPAHNKGNGNRAE